MNSQRTSKERLRADLAVAFERDLRQLGVDPAAEFLKRQQAEIERLRNVLHDYQCAHANLLLKVRGCPNCDAGAAHEPKTDEVPRLKDQIQSLQAQVDQLMFEYCPQEMSAEQIAEYEASQRATIPPSANTFLIFFHDQDRRPEVFHGDGAERGARERFRQISTSWNALLFGLIEDNCRHAETKSAGPDELNGESNPRAGVSVGQPFGPAAECMPGYWQCPNCKACNHLVIHHTSCPQCRTLRLASGESVE